MALDPADGDVDVLSLSMLAFSLAFQMTGRYPGVPARAGGERGRHRPLRERRQPHQNSRRLADDARDVVPAPGGGLPLCRVLWLRPLATVGRLLRRLAGRGDGRRHPLDGPRPVVRLLGASIRKATDGRAWDSRSEGRNHSSLSPSCRVASVTGGRPADVSVVWVAVSSVGVPAASSLVCALHPPIPAARRARR